MFEWLAFPFMVQALVACLAMGLLLAYLGIHVVGRGIVFVDLGLGQISSMGVAYATFAGRDPLLWSMIFTLVGAALFSGLRVRDPRLRLEAIIGIFYAVSSALTVVLIAKTPHGDADIQDVLFGNLLAIGPAELRRMLLIFAVVAVAHAALGKRFFALTYLKSSGEALAPREHALNLTFYVLLAFAIVFAIRAGGVIPVFAFLIIPSVAALFLARRTVLVVVLALAISALGSFLGLHVSFVYDLPVGASVVTALGALALVAAALRLALSARWGRGAAALLVATLALAGAAPARAQETAGDPEAGALEVLARQVEDLKDELRRAGDRITALEAELARLREESESTRMAAEEPPAAPPPAPAPAPRGGGGLKLIDISLDGLFAAAASTVPEEELRRLEFGGHDPKNRGFTAQNLELTLSGAVDPYLRGDANIVMQIDEEGETTVEIEEAYLTTLSLPAGLQVKGGTFFSSFGRLNPQHPHTWDFADQPVVNSRMFGPDGLRGPGAQLSWLLPTPFYAEATLGVQNSHGETAFSFRSAPGEEFAGRVLGERGARSAADLLYLGRLVTSFDLTPTLTIVPGASYVTGPNATGPDSRTSIAGIDLYGKWKPLNNDHGFPFAAVQLEAMERRYEAAAQVDGDGLPLPADTLRDRGAYLQGTWGFTRRWVAGLRYDWADGEGDTATDPLRDLRRRLSANLTFYPSEFSKVRLQLNRDRAEHLTDGSAYSLFLQFEYLYGAHGGHKF